MAKKSAEQLREMRRKELEAWKAKQQKMTLEIKKLEKEEAARQKELRDKLALKVGRLALDVFDNGMLSADKSDFWKKVADIMATEEGEKEPEKKDEPAKTTTVDEPSIMEKDDTLSTGGGFFSNLS